MSGTANELIWFDNADYPPYWNQTYHPKLSLPWTAEFPSSISIIACSPDIVASTDYGTVGSSYPNWNGSDTVFDFTDGSFLHLQGSFSAFTFTGLSSIKTSVIDGRPDPAGGYEVYYSTEFQPPVAHELGFWQNKIKTAETGVVDFSTEFKISEEYFVDFFYVDLPAKSNFIFRVLPKQGYESVTTVDICAYPPNVDPALGYAPPFYAYNESSMNLSITFLNAIPGRYYFSVNGSGEDNGKPYFVNYEILS